ncbi:MAG: adenylate kinase [Elusimicrobia bacterium RIFOXYB2_FULL_48_7]|nr:MAG: adenylate kinase [Elusimicrobia bacterium RIFOXYB2_FULL_48_7]
MNIILLGAPGAGKGTQAANIIKKYKIPHISTGDLFRATLKQDNPISREIQKYINKGRLVPDKIVISMFKTRVQRPDCRSGFISDGFPRNLFQVKALDGYLEEINRKIDAVIYLKLSSAESLKRLTARWLCPSCNRVYNMITQPPKKDSVCDCCGVKLIQRKDDVPETVKRRLAIYKKETFPILAYYSKQKKLLTIDANAQVAVVSNRIKSALKKAKNS